MSTLAEILTVKPERHLASCFPSAREYALAHKCPVCKAPPGQQCDAPRKSREWPPDPLGVMHARRQDIGIAHQLRDIGDAPWHEDES